MTNIREDENIFMFLCEKWILINKNHIWNRINQRINIIADFDRYQRARTISEGQRTENIHRNIYGAVPYDYNLVNLTSTQRNPLGYINASVAEFPEIGRHYIITGAAQDTQIPFFWQMVFEQKSPAIVMLLEDVELGIEKSDKYFPNNTREELKFGIYDITCKEFVKRNILEYRLLEVSVGNETHQVHHYKFHGWTEFNLPKYEDFMAFYNTMKEVGVPLLAVMKNNCMSSFFKKYHHTPPTNAPIIQCSTGGARCGVFIIIDILINLIDNRIKNSYSIEWWMLKVRSKRNHSALTNQQHSFIYDIIIKYIRTRHNQLRHLEKYLEAHANTVRMIDSTNTEDVDKFIKPRDWIVDFDERDRLIGKLQFRKRLKIEKDQDTYKYESYVLQ
ncbi:Tyrosine-protein phosphatase non-receptor type eak-6 [Caenorhabditis elegans]|uniref:Isoform a of Tyrosine-protein phosphatase non-receptor type eak-6 n=1 Tax=Caenorhabditis elegans TaxID=6239 RepID=G5EGU2-2|nr:Tyrosine-protein phosphatase non-receptor type eak-6 [Caenorhabditis elegans]ABI83733.1 EAK-6A isoform [Caenorhabditis elegans]CAP16268.1 Tyrosine-protein phosphatase non-receptor type eak-6 [Caenorhabditis elegans]|eukprot:NP_001122448.1 Tyrosine-protein phosphatase non-receptor type eak-6 [Caenorhabditis elegans]